MPVYSRAMATPGRTPAAPPPAARAGGTGYAQILLAYTVWGLLPMYWKQLSGADPVEILIHRTLWACALSWVVLAKRGAEALRLLREPAVLRAVGASALLLAVNWWIYVAAVNSGRIVEASLGYYMTPLVNVLLGVLFLGERLRGLQAAAFVMALAAVLALTVSHGRLPWISVGLAATFGLYALVRKTSSAESVAGFALETLLLTPIAAAVAIYLLATGRGRFGAGGETGWLLGAGAVTAMPLWLFASGVRKIPMKSVGFLQFLLPTLMLLVGVIVYREPFGGARALAFGVIWAALALYAVSLIRARRAPEGGPK